MPRNGSPRSSQHGCCSRPPLWPYGRGAHGPPPISRYMDLLSWAVLVNGVAFLGLVQREGARRRGMQAALAVWIAVQAFGIVRVSQTELLHLGHRQPWIRAHVQNVAQFMVTGDVAWFRTLPCTRPVALSGRGDSGQRMAASPLRSRHHALRRAGTAADRTRPWGWRRSSSATGFLADLRWIRCGWHGDRSQRQARQRAGASRAGRSRRA